MTWNGDQTALSFSLQVMKLYSVKSEVRYSPSMILVKLVGSYTISQVTLRISDIKRTKMVRPLSYPPSSLYSLYLTPSPLQPDMSMFVNNALLGGGVRVRIWIREKGKIRRRSKALLSL